MDNLAEVCHRIAEDDKQLTLPYDITSTGELVILRRPYKPYTLASLAVDIGRMNEGKANFCLEGRRLERCELRWLAHQLVQAVKRLHSIGLSHGSISPENILVDSRLNLSLCDVAPFKPLFLGKDDPSQWLLFYPISSLYLAPERFVDERDQQERDDALLLKQQKSDVWSLGQILKHLLGDLPQILQLLEGRDLAEFEDIFPETSVTNFVLPLFREIRTVKEFCDYKDDLLTLVNEQELLVRFLLNWLPFIETNDDLLLVADMLQALGGLDTHPIFKDLVCKPCKNSDSIESEFAAVTLRSIKNIQDLDKYSPAILLHPDEHVRREASARLGLIANREPISQDLFELLLRNPSLAEKLSDVDLKPILPQKRGDRLLFRTREDLGIKPNAVEEREGSIASLESFSSSISGSSGTEDLTSYRKCSFRRLPFQFDSFKLTATSPEGSWFALVSASSSTLSVWRTGDFKSQVVPGPRWTVKLDQDPTLIRLSDERVFIVFDHVLRILNLESMCEVPVDFTSTETIVEVLDAGDKGLILATQTKIILPQSCCSIPEEHGEITHLICKEFYAVSCTTNGYLQLWDLRFGLLLKSWRMPLDLSGIVAISWFAEKSIETMPKLWILSGCLLIVDLAGEIIISASDQSFVGKTLLTQDVSGTKESTKSGNGSEILAMATSDECAIISHSDSRLSLLASPDLQPRPLRLVLSKPVVSIDSLGPTAVNSSDSASFLVQFQDQSCGLLEFVK